ncbi:MAG: hypothetical protein ICV59_01045 [Thermoleophilia bacterium]|nr:hypothetical protein [Thermoleophilia bacterium]
MELGYLQLCADRRFHRRTMEAFEAATGLGPDEYWIEARPGGAPAYPGTTNAGRLAYREGALHMGWAAHGDRCLGFSGESNDEIRRKLHRAARARAEEFARAIHYELFGEGGDVTVVRVA